MASPRQIAANRRNAAMSTGPRTPEGKRRVSANAVQHGFYGTTFTIPGESHAGFQAIYDEFFAEHLPVGPVETALVQHLTLAHFRILRFQSLIAAAFERRVQTVPADSSNLTAEAAFSEDIRWNKEIVHLDRMLNSAERAFSRTLRDLTRLQKELVHPQPPLEDTIALDGAEPLRPKPPGPDFDPRRSSEQSQSRRSTDDQALPPHIAILKEMGLNCNYERIDIR